MSADIVAFISFDDNSPANEAAFTNDPSWWSLEDDYGLRGCKDHGFIAAISGLQNNTGIPPLIPLRGCPPKPPVALKEYDGEPTSFLTRSELLRCLEHHNLTVDRLAPEVQTALSILKVLVDKHGDERVRFVFVIVD